MRLNAKQIASYTGGTFLVQPIDASALMCGLTWDSRDVEPGWLYVALPGERVDGHDFVAAALRAGAAGALVMQTPDAATEALAREMGAALIEVPNTASAITDLAREWRGHLRARVIGLTGSVGKTTTKNLVRDVLAAKFATVATRANQNNELGVPKTLLSADPETDMVVVEMGMRGLGQITHLAQFVRPDWGIVTNVGDSHIELLGTRENIARAKAELPAALPAGGIAFLNGADDMAGFVHDVSELERHGAHAVCFDGSGSYDVHAPADGTWHYKPAVWAEDVELDDEGRPHFALCARGFVEQWPPAEGDHAVERCACSLVLRGAHNVANACCAAAVGRAAGMELTEIAAALSSSVPEGGRMEVLRARGGFTVVNDAYNASPDSMRAALSMLAALSVRGKRYAVLGDMGELGDHARACHLGVGEAAAAAPLDLLICVGELAQGIADGAVAAGMPEDKIVRAATIADVLGELDARVEAGDAVLVKASNFMGLSRVVEGLVD